MLAPLPSQMHQLVARERAVKPQICLLVCGLRVQDELSRETTAIMATTMAWFFLIILHVRVHLMMVRFVEHRCVLVQCSIGVADCYVYPSKGQATGQRGLNCTLTSYDAHSILPLCCVHSVHRSDWFLLAFPHQKVALSVSEVLTSDVSTPDDSDCREDECSVK